MKKIAILLTCALAVVLLSSCSKMKRDSEMILGTWTSTTYYSSTNPDGAPYNGEKLVFFDDGTSVFYQEGKILWSGIPYTYDNAAKTLTFKDGKEDIVYKVPKLEENLLRVNWGTFEVEYKLR